MNEIKVFVVRIKEEKKLNPFTVKIAFRNPPTSEDIRSSLSSLKEKALFQRTKEIYQSWIDFLSFDLIWNPQNLIFCPAVFSWTESKWSSNPNLPGKGLSMKIYLGTVIDN